MRRVLLALAALVLVIDVATVTGAIGAGTEVAEATEAAVPVVERPATTTLATLPPTTTAPPTTVAPTTLPAATGQPVNAPKNPYALEPYRTIGRIDIPKLGLSAPLGEGISLRTIDRGPSHWPGTAMPGQKGNVVVAGHRVSYTKPFRYIDTLVPGDEVFFEYEGARYRYVMTSSLIVTPQQTEIVNQTPDATATLFACHPPGSARYRYVVRLTYAPSAP